MDSARIRRRTSSSPQLPPTAFSTQVAPDIFDAAVECDAFEPDASPTRRQKLLNTRNTRFPGKKLSITGIGNKISQLIGKNEQLVRGTSSRDQENNTLHKSKSDGTIGKRGSLGILEEISNTGRSQSARRREDIPIYQDHTERPLLQSSPFTSSPYIDPRGELTSPLEFDHIQDNLNEMRLRELSINVDWSPATKSPTLKAKSRKCSAPAHFDADDYIEHIEKELQQTRDEAYSPLTRRPMKEKLRAANKEIERLQKELAQMREKFETEVKRTVEHKTLAELELKRKVRDLEETLEDKDHTIKDLQYQHEERRLDSNIITSLKATIERLEQDKLDMEEINLGMSKRNEVLTQLLAMSPTKASDAFNLRSPVREKRNARPISLILPRRATSPNGNQYANPISTVCSPRLLNSADISPFRLSPDQDFPLAPGGSPHRASTTPQRELVDPMGKVQSPAHETRSRRSTLYSDISASSGAGSGLAAFLNDDKVQTRRKARRFMAGSTQLKPLLLPSMTGEPMTLSSASTASSPRSWPARAPSEVDVDDTILANVEMKSPARDDFSLPEATDAPTPGANATSDGRPGPTYAGQRLAKSLDTLPVLEPHFGTTNRSDEADPDSLLNQSPEMCRTPARIQASTTELSVEHLKLHNSQYSLHTMPVPETPESLVSRPQPLFSVSRNIAPETSRLPSGSPCIPPDFWEVSVSKKRKHSLGATDHPSPAPKIHCSRQLGYLPTATTTVGIPRSPITSSSASSAKKRLSQIRSTDNFVDLLRQKNFAARPLAALTIRTVYTLLSTCTNAVRDFRRDPFALARRVLANAWRSNWKMFGKVSWWVLGLFVQPRTKSRARAPIDWDQYDGESIASRYCNTDSQDLDIGTTPDEQEEEMISREAQKSQDHDGKIVGDAKDSPAGWGRSMFLWGKFSAALMLAVTGAVIKGPSEMLKEINPSTKRGKESQRSCKKCRRREEHEQKVHEQLDTPRSQQLIEPGTSFMALGEGGGSYTPDFEFRCQLESSSLLEQIQQPDCDSTLRPETTKRGRLGSLFSPTPSSGELVSRMQDLRLSSADLSLSKLAGHYPDTHSTRDEG